MNVLRKVEMLFSDCTGADRGRGGRAETFQATIQSSAAAAATAAAVPRGRTPTIHPKQPRSSPPARPQPTTHHPHPHCAFRQGTGSWRKLQDQVNIRIQTNWSSLTSIKETRKRMITFVTLFWIDVVMNSDLTRPWIPMSSIPRLHPLIFNLYELYIPATPPSIFTYN